MKRKLLLTSAVLSLLLLGGCTKPDPSGPDDPGSSEITSNNASPAGFSDDGPSQWDE